MKLSYSVGAGILAEATAVIETAAARELSIPLSIAKPFVQFDFTGLSLADSLQAFSTIDWIVNNIGARGLQAIMPEVIRDLTREHKNRAPIASDEEVVEDEKSDATNTDAGSHPTISSRRRNNKSSQQSSNAIHVEKEELNDEEGEGNDE